MIENRRVGRLSARWIFLNKPLPLASQRDYHPSVPGGIKHRLFPAPERSFSQQGVVLICEHLWQLTSHPTGFKSGGLKQRTAQEDATRSSLMSPSLSRGISRRLPRLVIFLPGLENWRQRFKKYGKTSHYRGHQRARKKQYRASRLSLGQRLRGYAILPRS